MLHLILQANVKTFVTGGIFYQILQLIPLLQFSMRIDREIKVVTAGAQIGFPSEPQFGPDVVVLWFCEGAGKTGASSDTPGVRYYQTLLLLLLLLWKVYDTKVSTIHFLQ